MFKTFDDSIPSRYIMNHINALTKYTKTLDLLLKDPNNASESASCCVSPMAFHIRSVVSELECKLDDISKLYQDDSLRHFFLMNNTRYIALEVQGSKLRTILGEEWIHEQYRKSEQQAMDYEGATWSSVLSLLKDEGIQNPVQIPSQGLFSRLCLGGFIALLKRFTNAKLDG